VYTLGPVVDILLSYFEGALQRAITRLESTSAAGLDGIPAAFDKHAFYVTGNRPAVRDHLFLPLLAVVWHLFQGLHHRPNCKCMASFSH
jgi:hypothetical protein